MKTLKDLKKWANELKKEGNSLGDTLEEYIEGWENDLLEKEISSKEVERISEIISLLERWQNS